MSTTTVTTPSSGEANFLMRAAEYLWVYLPMRLVQRSPNARMVAGDWYGVALVPLFALLAPLVTVASFFAIGATRFGYTEIYTESLLVMGLFIAVGSFSAQLGFLALVSFAVGDFIVGHDKWTASAYSSGGIFEVAELRVPLLISYLLLAVPVLLIPTVGKNIVLAVGQWRTFAPWVMWLIATPVMVVTAWLGVRTWTAMGPTLIRPYFTWPGRDPIVEAVAPLQTEGHVLVAVAVAAMVARQAAIGVTVFVPHLSRDISAMYRRGLWRLADVDDGGRASSMPSRGRLVAGSVLSATMATLVLSGIIESWFLAATVFAAFLVVRLIRMNAVMFGPVTLWKTLLNKVPLIVRLVALWLIVVVYRSVFDAVDVQSYSMMAWFVVAGVVLSVVIFPGPPPHDEASRSDSGRSDTSGPPPASGVKTQMFLIAAAVGGAWWWNATPAFADNCSVYDDCFGQSGAASEAALGLTLLSLLSIIFNLIPVLGDGKGLIETFAGKDLFTGEELEEWERVLGVVGLIPGADLLRLAKLGKLGKGADAAGLLDDAGRGVDDVADASRLDVPASQGRSPLSEGGRGRKVDNGADDVAEAGTQRAPRTHAAGDTIPDGTHTERMRELADEYADASTSQKRKLSELIGEAGGANYIESTVGRDLPAFRPTSAADVSDLVDAFDDGRAWDRIVAFENRNVINMAYFDGEKLHIVEAKGGASHYNDRQSSLYKNASGEERQLGNLTKRIDQTNPKYPKDVAVDMAKSPKDDGRNEVGKIIKRAYEGDSAINYVGVRTSGHEKNSNAVTVLEHIFK